MSECINKYSLSIIINEEDSDMTIPCSPSMSTTSTTTLSSPSPSPPPPRKGSIASMLNSIDELVQLDHEEWLTNYQTHFQTNKNITNMEVETRDKQQQFCQQKNNDNNDNYNNNNSNNNNNNNNNNKKGLRLFSQHICDIIQHYGKINYHQLVQKLCDTKDIYLTTKTTSSTCHKNIKRRVYDALNVLMAIGVIRKENKYIYWKGYPFNIIHDDNINDDHLLMEIQNEQQRYYSLKSRILEKQYQIQQIIYQHNTFSLMQQ